MLVFIVFSGGYAITPKPYLVWRGGDAMVDDYTIFLLVILLIIIYLNKK